MVVPQEITVEAEQELVMVSFEPVTVAVTVVDDTDAVHCSVKVEPLHCAV